MVGFNQEMVLDQPALGHDVQLGMLYDVRSSQFFAGVSLCNNDVVNANQKLDEDKTQDAKYELSYSLEEARKNTSLNIDLGSYLLPNIYIAQGTGQNATRGNALIVYLHSSMTKDTR